MFGRASHARALRVHARVPKAALPLTGPMFTGVQS